MVQTEFLTVPFDKALIDKVYDIAKAQGLKGGRTEYIYNVVSEAVKRDGKIIKGQDPDQMEMEV